MLTTEERMEYIRRRLETADDPEIDELYWFLIFSEESRQHSTDCADPS